MTNKPEPNTRAGGALKPCERCGGKPTLCEPNYADEGGTMVVCEDCDLASDSFVLGEYGEGRAQAITAWNTRPLPQPSELVDDDARLILRLAGVRNKLTPGAIERADLDGMAFTIGESQDRIAEMSAQIAKLQADGDKLAGALEAFQRHYDLNDCDERCGALEVPISDLRRACQALTEWKDRA